MDRLRSVRCVLHHYERANKMETQCRVASPQQQAFYDWIDNGQGSCTVIAVAGSGKTTTLIDGLPRMHGRVALLVYNKKIEIEIKGRVALLVQEGLYVSTMHAAGFGAWRRVATNARVDENKCRDIYRKLLMATASLESPVLKLVSLAKQSALGTDGLRISDLALAGLIEHFDIDTMGADEMVIDFARVVLTRSVESDTAVIDFDDMIYAPLVHKVRMNQYDWVLIDEAQDTNAARRMLALRMLKPGGRLVAVGDPRQAIYGFTGADADSLELIAKAVNARDLPLTVTYRCPKSVVKYAQQWVSHITAHDSAPDGSVIRHDSKRTPLSSVCKPGDAILCRFNAPLIGQAYSFIAAGIPARVEGREIGAGLKALARRWRVASYATLSDRLDEYVARETKKYRAKEQEARAVAVEDRAECLRTLIARISRIDPRPSNPVQRLCDEIDSIFGDSIDGSYVLLSSIHKSKGREWDRVFWLQTGASPWARQPWEVAQEDNLCYVAATRAKRELVLVD